MPIRNVFPRRVLIASATGVAALGLMGATTATTASADGSNAALAQYPPDTSGTVPATPPSGGEPPASSSEAPPATSPQTPPAPSTSPPTRPVAQHTPSQTPQHSSQAPRQSEPTANADPVTEPVAQMESGSLPFTGYDVRAVLLIGVLLVGGGATLWRKTRSRSHP